MITALPHQHTLGEALGTLTSGVYVVTAHVAEGHQTRRGGMIASWVMQAGFVPPSITVAMAPGRYVDTLIRQTGRFTVNVLGEKQYGLMKPFGKGTEDPFVEIPFTDTQCGVVLPEAVAWMDCVVLNRLHSSTDHDILLAEVVAGSRVQTAFKPMAHTRPTGFQY